MDFSTNPDYFLGPWVDIPAEIPTALTTATKGQSKSTKKQMGQSLPGMEPMQSAMVGFWMVDNAKNRDAFSDQFLFVSDRPNSNK